MDTITFLDKALAVGNFYCLLALKDGGKEKENRRQVFFNSREKLAAASVEWDNRGWDAFFALGSFEESGYRTAERVQNVKSFFVDLDIGDDPKKYATRDEAIADLRAFCKQFDLPKPTVVNSGYGVHVYWMLKEHVPMHDWSCAAAQFKKVMSEYGLRADPAVTADCARVLRIPLTHNHKQDTPKEVTVAMQGGLVDFETFISKLGLDSIPVPTKVEQDAASAFLDAIIRNKESSFRTILEKTAEGRGCRQLEIIVTDQENTSEPMWRAGLSIAKFCADGRKAAKIISHKHPEYDEGDTAEKFDRIKGPYLCSTFDSNYEGVCTDCPNWGKVKSPISLGSRVKEAAPNEVIETATNLPNAPKLNYVIPQYPKPYFRGANGGVYMRSSNADGDVEEELIYHNDLYVTQRIKDPETGEVVAMRLHKPQDGVSEFTIPLMSVTSREEFRKEMSKQGVAVPKVDKIMQYVLSWVNELQATQKVIDAHRQFGWTDAENNNYDTFIWGNTTIEANSISFNPPSTQTAGLFPAMEPKGSLQGWKDCVNFYNRDGLELHQYVVGTAFGSILMPFFGREKCAALHIHSKGTGHGKTTALHAAATVWGSPEALVIEKTDTHNTKMNRGEIYHNLPLYMDELTNESGDKLSDLVYQLTTGKQRNRMVGSVNAERFRGLPWQLLAVTTGNTSIIEVISMLKNSPMAEAQRMLECHCKKSIFAKEETDKFNAALGDNYGQAAIPYVQYIMNNVDAVAKLCIDVRKRIDALAKLENINRFWSIHAAATISGLLIAKKVGLIDYDITKTQKFIVGVIEANKANTIDMTTDVEQLVTEYLLEHWGKFLKIKSTDDLRKGNGNGLDQLVIPEMMPSQDVFGRYETDLNKVFIVPKYLKKWCGKQQVNYAEFLKELKSKLGAETLRKRIMKGTPAQVLAQPVITFIIKLDVEQASESGDS